ncbi:MAG: DUF983 domain-containing protein [Chitinophagaceae bacterium]|nr:MAG: DUF983 domain-containing protein [Chitinophagaceae bacterium]
MTDKQPKRSYFISAVKCHCPRCREGNLFKNSISIRLKKNMEMNKNCPVCGQPTEVEPGFYYGTGYVSYALTVALSITTFIAWFFTIGMSVDDNRFFIWIISNAVLLIFLQPWLMRLSRSIWISWFVKYDRNWKNNQVNKETIERILPDQQMSS